MPNVLIRGGVEVEIPSRREIAHTVREELTAYSSARAKKRMEAVIPIATPAGTVFLGQAQTGPEEGYVWSLKLVSVTLAASGTCTLYKASSSGDTRRPLQGISPSGVVAYFSWSSDQARLKHGEGLYFVASQNINGVYVCAWQAPAEMEALIYD